MQLSHLVQSIPDGRRLHFHDLDIRGLADDSRKVSRGDLFFAVRGTALDGHRFVPEALDRGAQAVVCERDDCLPRPVPGLVVEDSRRAMALLAHAFYGCPASKLLSVGVTGTNGKTTTTYLVREILREAGMRPGLIGTVGYSFGGGQHPIGQTTPGALELARLLSFFVGADCRSLVMEVSSHALDQHRVEGIEYRAGVFTNLTRDHLDYHENFARYLDAKAKLFEGLPADGVAILNRDVPESLALAGRTGARCLYYGFTPGAEVVGRVERMTLDGTRFALALGGGHYQVDSRLIGRYNVSNMLAAAATAHGLGIDAGAIVSGLEGLSGVPGRLERIQADLPFHVLVDYAHTEDALQNVLSTVRGLVRRRILLVFGCGGNRDRGKRGPMGRVASRFADRLWVTSDNPRNEDPEAIARQVTAGVLSGTDCTLELDREAAIRQAIDAAEPGDLVLVAGKGHEDYQEIGGRRIPFDDREVARHAILARKKRKGGVGWSPPPDN
ncbi:MAG: UDP-N-acetylmuramoyl-L-alanyl-D-glutamate--2,6-diaminopimelate ligase [Planctomycetes bacterium]|nr:UDP-N-acetylmuramoyl-L-alanyl-D-glutamate--2,6-diaminopimelate ligase [Planctomycetota bacterium]